MSSRGQRPTLIAAGLVALSAVACSSEPTVIQLPALEMLIASGDGQFGVVGEDLGAPLRVLVRSQATEAPREEVDVVWEITQGDASVIGVSTTPSDDTGSAEIHIHIGTTPGEIHVTAHADGEAHATVTFQVWGVNRPTLSDVAPNTAIAGQTVTLTGTDFSPLAEQDVVLFSGIRGRVLGATQSSLVVEVPECLPARLLDVSVQLGAVPAVGSLPLTVTGGTQVTEMQVGDVVDVADDSGLACHALAGAGGAQYLVLPYSGSAVGAARHPFRLTVLSSAAAAVAAGAEAPRAEPISRGVGAQTSPQQLWDERLRTLEDGLVRSRAAERLESAAAAGPAGVPAVGERRTFNVLNASGGFDRITAVAELVGTRAAIFVDEEAPAGGLTASDLAAMAQRFDQVIYPVDTGTFGAVSDLDGNERVIILFTPAVNRLTPRNSSGFIGGYFYGIDLLTTNANSNRAEIFYALVPDPNGLFADPHTRQQVVTSVPAVLAHEFQHMVHFNERVLVRGAASQEALWLSEALAQMAEELVAREYFSLGDGGSTTLFRAGVVQRARLYLGGPDSVSLVVTAGQGSLAERGGGFLSLLYLESQMGPDILGRLTRTTRTGVANVEAETGLAWPDLLANWWAATYLDGSAPSPGPLGYPTIDLRAYLGGSFPLVPGAMGPGDATSSGALPSSAVRYHLLSPPAGGTSSVRLGGEAGGPSASQAALRLRLIRVS